MKDNKHKDIIIHYTNKHIQVCMCDKFTAKEKCQSMHSNGNYKNKSLNEHYKSFTSSLHKFRTNFYYAWNANIENYSGNEI